MAQYDPALRKEYPVFLERTLADGTKILEDQNYSLVDYDGRNDMVIEPRDCEKFMIRPSLTARATDNNRRKVVRHEILGSPLPRVRFD